jgi:ABC-type sugar transport system substrate-binding protein
MSRNVRKPRPTTMRGLAALGAAAALLAACGTSSKSNNSSSGGSASSSTSSQAAGSSKSVAGKSVVFVTCSAAQNPWCGGVNKEFTAKMKAAGVKVTVLQDAQDPSVQAQHMNQAIALHPSLIAVQPDDVNAIVPSLRKAKTAGIPVLNWNGTITGAGQALVVSSVVADNPQLGTLSGENLVAGLQKAGYKKANILVLTGTQSLPITPQRVDAFKAVLAKYPNYKIVETQDTNFDPNTAASDAAQAIAQWKSKGGLQGAWGMADYLATPIATAAKQAGLSVGAKPGGMVIVGGNCSAQGVAAVRNGTLYGDNTQAPGPEADAIAKAVTDYLGGTKIKPVISINEQKFTKADVETYAGQCTY